MSSATGCRLGLPLGHRTQHRQRYEHYAPTLRLAVRHSTNAGTLGGPKTSTLLGAVFGGVVYSKQMRCMTRCGNLVTSNPYRRPARTAAPRRSCAHKRLGLNCLGMTPARGLERQLRFQYRVAERIGGVRRRSKQSRGDDGTDRQDQVGHTDLRYNPLSRPECLFAVAHAMESGFSSSSSQRHLLLHERSRGKRPNIDVKRPTSSGGILANTNNAHALLLLPGALRVRKDATAAEDSLRQGKAAQRGPVLHEREEEERKDTAHALGCTLPQRNARIAVRCWEDFRHVNVPRQKTKI
jgi:hypothetical protein